MKLGIVQKLSLAEENQRKTDYILDLLEVNMFKVIYMCGSVDIAYGTFIEKDGNSQFI